MPCETATDGEDLVSGVTKDAVCDFGISLAATTRIQQAGETELFVSGDAEHQGPDGGGPIAVIARCVAG
jgi:hypothetical protein